MERIVFVPGEKVSLVIPEKQDFELLLKAANNINITKYWWPISHNTYESETKFLNDILENRKKYFMIMINESKKVVGSVTFHTYDEQSRNGLIGISIYDENELGKWYGTAGMNLFLQYAFQYLGCNKVKLQVSSNNPRAIASYEKSGFKTVWIFKQENYIMWEYVDSIAMELLRSEWEELKIK